MFRKIAAAIIAATVISPASALAATWDAYGSFNGTTAGGQFHYFGYTGPNIGQGLKPTGPDTCAFDIVCTSFGDSTFLKPGPGTPGSVVIDDGSVVTVPTDRLVVDPGDFGSLVTFVAPTAGLYYVQGAFDGIETLNSGIGLAIISSVTSPAPVITPNTVPHGATFNGAFTLNQNQLVGFFFGPGQRAYHDLTSFSFRVSDSPFAAVPEPSAWAMMLLGFGGLGVALRRRRLSAA